MTDADKALTFNRWSIALHWAMVVLFVLVRRWYGLFNKRHGGKMQVFLQETEALDAVDKIDRARLRRGYVRKTVTRCATRESGAGMV